MHQMLAVLALVFVPVMAQVGLHSEFSEHARFVNARNTSWRAEVPTRFTTVAQVKQLCGSKRAAQRANLSSWARPSAALEQADLPADFDSRTQWPLCPGIAEIRDQSECGSCWAFGAAEAMSDRICIATNGSSKPRLSATYFLKCCSTCSGDTGGCDGGFPDYAWDWAQSNGVSTGGAHGSNDWCLAYPFPKCRHHNATGPYAACPKKPYVSDKKCPAACDSNSTYKTALAEDTTAHKFASAYYLPPSILAMQQELMAHGPFEANMLVYSDFPAYKSGVYHHVTGALIGQHAVRLLGWGTEAGADYWLVANSWNEAWGDKGFFKIRRGMDECGIEGGQCSGGLMAGVYKK